MTMRQIAPDPTLLFELVHSTTYRNGWHFALKDFDRGQGSEGLTLIITVDPVDTNNQDWPKRINHYMIVPAAAYDTRSWRRWLFDQILLVEQHEACEFFRVNGEQPYAPSHGPGNDPYLVREIGTEADATTNFRGHRVTA